VLGLRWAVITRSAREAGAWEAVGAQVLVLGADLHDLDGALDAFMAQRQADALVLRPDHFVYAAVRASEALPAPPAVLNQTRKAISL